ncbi:MAG: hypothetical protein R2697_00270 [Ilumatobacteraceae bacterium]
MNGPMPRDDDHVDTGAVTVPDDRAEVARVGDTVDRDDERGMTAASAQVPVEIGLGQVGREGEDTLRRLAACRLLQLLAAPP